MQQVEKSRSSWGRSFPQLFPHKWARSAIAPLLGKMHLQLILVLQRYYPQHSCLESATVLRMGSTTFIATNNAIYALSLNLPLSFASNSLTSRTAMDENVSKAKSYQMTDT
jgi:hypothetical protein